MKTQLITILLAAAIAVFFIAGCQSDAQTGTAVGALAGAGIGQLAGGDTEATLIGSAIGAGAGYIFGNESDKKKTQQRMDCLQDDINSTTVNVTNSNGSIIRVKLRNQGVGYIGPRGEYYSKLPTQEQLRPVYGF
jgi:hypothetical protein